MVNVSYTSLFSEILPLMVADPSQPLTLAVVRRTVREFCARTRVWQEQTDPADVVAGQALYDIDLPPGASPVAFLGLTVDGDELTPIGPAMRRRGAAGNAGDTGTPRWFSHVQYEQVQVWPTPDRSQAAAMVATVALQPSMASTAFPGFLAERYGAAIADGAAAKLMLMPRRDWSDPAAGVDLRNRFEAAIANASARAVTEPGVIRTTPIH